jgi:predicted enzyme related to lactoylglutathione lyase
MQTVGGHFIWHDLSTTDVDAAKHFYGEITSWNAQPWEDAKHYDVWLNGDARLGGVSRAGANAPPGWLPYVCVYDVDATARQVPKLGGKVLSGPTEMPNVGAWAVIQDPTGGVVGVYEPTQGIPANGQPRRGDFSWHELGTTDFNAAFDFYRKLFAWEKVAEHDMGEMGTYVEFGQKGRPYGGMFNRKEGMPGERGWLSYVRVADVDAGAEAVKRLGGTVTAGPMDVPGGDRIAMCRDPQGAAFALHQQSLP